MQWVTICPCMYRPRFSGTFHPWDDMSHGPCVPDWCVPTPTEPGKAASLCHYHRLNMELDLQSLFWLHVYSCTHWLKPRNSPPSPLIWAHIRGRYSLCDPCHYQTCSVHSHCAAFYHLVELYLKLQVMDGICGDTSLKGLFLQGRKIPCSKDVRGRFVPGRIATSQRRNDNDVHMCRLWPSAALTGCGQLVSIS